MKQHLFSSIAFLLLFLFLPFSAHAEDVVRFYFEQIEGKLQLDSSLPQAIVRESDPDFSIIDFAKQDTFGDYRIDLIDVTNAVSVQTQFMGKDGKFSYVMPHLGIIKGYRIYSTKSNELLLEGSLGQFVQCNANGVCEFEKGESLNTCLSDCVSGSFSEETQKLLKQNNDVIKDPKTGEVVLRGIQPVPVTPTGNAGTANDGANIWVLIISGVILLLIGGSAWLILKLRKRNKQYGL